MSGVSLTRTLRHPGMTRVVSTWQQYLCAQEAAQVINPILTELYRDGTAKPTVFRDRKDQIDQAASSCGLSLK